MRELGKPPLPPGRVYAGVNKVYIDCSLRRAIECEREQSREIYLQNDADEVCTDAAHQFSHGTQSKESAVTMGEPRACILCVNINACAFNYFVNNIYRRVALGIKRCNA